ncbi:ribonuclease HI family protein [Amphibacillus jilinensis]|uniref:ribonuclease HI family protein n=1 Tax=Amphibacillus jilinensis TaxID=1216008 RepID=UPI0002F6108A
MLLTVYIDGATAGYPGPSGTSFIIKNKDNCQQGYTYIGITTNHEAEFKALINALQYCHLHYPDQILSIRSDSKLVVDAVERGYVKNKQFQPLLQKAQPLIDSFPHCFIKWIPDNQNKQADHLAKLAIQTKEEAVTECLSL